jgi:hypothetical protein
MEAVAAPLAGRPHREDHVIVARSAAATADISG